MEKAIVKHPAREPKDWGYGPRINVVFTLADGREEKLWGEPGDRIKDLVKKQEITVRKDGKNWTLVDTPGMQQESRVEASNTTGQVIPRELPADLKMKMYNNIIDLSGMIVYAYEKVSEAVDAQEEKTNTLMGLSAEDKRSMATSVFIQTCRKFNL